VLRIEEARQRLLGGIAPITETERIAVPDALGRILAEDVSAPVDLPPFDNSAMDGYAVNTQDPVWRGAPPFALQVIGTSFAGRPWHGKLTRGAVRIFTGAAIPNGADTVIAQEDAEHTDTHVVFNKTPSPNRHMRPVGDDVKKGSQIFARSDQLRAFELGWAAACGIETLSVFTRPKIGVFATGDELRAPGTALAYGQIFESNRLMLRSVSANLPAHVRDLGILSDDRAQLHAALGRAAQQHDMLITSGGVSVGESDYVRNVVETLGSIEFWRVAIKPGKPFASGRIGNCLFMGLPGNPASAVVTFLLFVAPAIRTLAGGHAPAPIEVDAMLDVAIEPSATRTDFQRGRYSQQRDGLHVAPTGSQGSNRIGSFRDANCLIKLEPGVNVRASGERVSILPFAGLLG